MIAYICIHHKHDVIYINKSLQWKVAKIENPFWMFRYIYNIWGVKALLKLHIFTLSPCSCGQGVGWRWVLYPVWKEKQSGLPKGWAFWSNSAKGSGKKVQWTVGHCLEWNAGCCGKVASECPAPEARLQYALASGEGAARVSTGCEVWSPAVGFLDSQ